MASKTAIAGVLAYLHELYPTREIGPATGEAWALTFADWDDAELQVCAKQAATTAGRTFFPTPGEIAACRTTTPIVDAARLLRRIESLGRHNAVSGYIAPEVEYVRRQLGDVIADAYAAAGGGSRCFSEDPTTRSIAYREFQRRAEEFAATPNAERPPLELPGGDRRRIAQPEKLESIGAVVTRALPIGATP